MTTQVIEGLGLLTGNPFVDNGLAVIAALANCDSIDQLTLARIREVHGDGKSLARHNDRLRSTSSVFLDSMLTNPSYRKNPDRLVNYASITTAICNNIGHETIPRRCAICGNKDSVDLDSLFIATFGKDSDEGKKRHFVGRDWFPLAGSMGSDAQALPSASGGLNCCAKCLLAVQYLPQCVFSMKGKLTVFSSTSIAFWYRLTRRFANEIRRKLVGNGKVETIGTKADSDSGGEGGGVRAAIRRMLIVMRNMHNLDPHTSVTMWLFSNMKAGDCSNERIPNFALSFLRQVARHVPESEIMPLIGRDTNYHSSLLNCVINREDYRRLYRCLCYIKPVSWDIRSEIYRVHLRSRNIAKLAYSLNQRSSINLA